METVIVDGWANLIQLLGILQTISDSLEYLGGLLAGVLGVGSMIYGVILWQVVLRACSAHEVI